MQESQDWCLNCGAGAPGNVRGGPGWRSAALAFGSSAILALGAAAAAYAALKQSSPPPKGPTAPVAQTPPPTSTTTSSSTTSTSSIPPSTNNVLPEGTGKPPKIPSSESTPEGSGNGLFGEEGRAEQEKGKSHKEGSSGKAGSGEGKKGGEEKGEQGNKGGSGETSDCVSGKTSTEEVTSSESTSSGSSSNSSSSTSVSSTETTSDTSSSEASSTSEQKEEAEERNCRQAKSAPIVLDTNAASTYDPNGYPEAAYGDPSLAIDGEATTSWTAPLAPEIGPLVQSGLLLNLKSQLRIAKVTLITSTPGMSVQIYGTTQRKPPSSLNSAAWLKLSRVHVVAQRKSSVGLQRTPKIRQLLVWIVKAPQGAESVAVGEAELYEPK